jgi:hypothetical protein
VGTGLGSPKWATASPRRSLTGCRQ